MLTIIASTLRFQAMLLDDDNQTNHIVAGTQTPGATFLDTDNLAKADHDLIDMLEDFPRCVPSLLHS